jgi:hypothetical protein
MIVVGKSNLKDQRSIRLDSNAPIKGVGSIHSDNTSIIWFI